MAIIITGALISLPDSRGGMQAAWTAVGRRIDIVVNERINIEDIPNSAKSVILNGWWGGMFLRFLGLDKEVSGAREGIETRSGSDSISRGPSSSLSRSSSDAISIFEFSSFSDEHDGEDVDWLRRRILWEWCLETSRCSGDPAFRFEAICVLSQAPRQLPGVLLTVSGMAKKKNKLVRITLTIVLATTLLFLMVIFQVLRPWCWYCEREFEDEKGDPRLPPTFRRGLIDIMISVDAASKGKTLQMSTLSSQAQHCRRSRRAYPTSA
jgi:hypothetical protein